MKALILDWDGVFHDGRKGPDGSSTFSEIDSMGLNLLRFGHYLQTKTLLPIAIVTGERNASAEAFAAREHLNHFCYFAKDKRRALAPLQSAWGIDAADWGFLFDDVLDFGLAAEVGLRAMVYREACEETYHYAVNQGLVDWTIPADHAVRRFAERALTEAGLWEATLEGRIEMSPAYRAYWAARQELSLEVLDLREEAVR
jgi:3-deoxy-D-manno-octulosonate 8-phosphate phosphatase (KDO 8-P phosphatase)